MNARQINNHCTSANNLRGLMSRLLVKSKVTTLTILLSRRMPLQIVLHNLKMMGNSSRPSTKINIIGLQNNFKTHPAIVLNNFLIMLRASELVRSLLSKLIHLVCKASISSLKKDNTIKMVSLTIKSSLIFWIQNKRNPRPDRSKTSCINCKS